MKDIVRRSASLLLVVMMIFSLSATVWAAENDGYEFNDLGEKTAESLVKPGQYEITVGVPGAVVTEQYSEVIIMVDASSSQGSNLGKLKTMLVDIAEEILHNDGSVRLTLMGYGMGPANIGSFYNAETLEAYLAGVTQRDLRQGVSATNCEAALEFVHEYVNNSEKLEQTVVIFTSDGMTNMDETPFALSAWVEHPEWYASGATIADIASLAAGGQMDILLSGGAMFSGTVELYPDEALAIELAKELNGAGSEHHAALIEELYNKIVADEESQVAYVNAVWADVFEYSGLTYADDVAYSTSELEKAFLDFHNGALTYSYLNAIHGMMSAAFYPDWSALPTWGGRAADAADSLAENDKVLELYMVDFAAKNNTWMNPDCDNANRVTSDNITYQSSSSFSAAVDQIGQFSDEWFTTVYMDTTVVDPMSKWVDLDPGSIRIYEDELLIYEYGTGWLYEDRQPAENPITLTQDEDGKYVITWRIKDGPLLYTDRYFLKYVVDVDETVEGFEYGKEYPANDPTTVHYVDEHDEPQEYPIDVPDVLEYEEPEDFEDGDLGVKIFKGSLENNTPISDIVFDIYQVIPGEGDTRSLIPTEEEIAKYAVADNLIASVTTNSSGYASYNFTEHGYGEGIYLFVEQSSDKVVAPVDPFYVVLPMYDTESETYIDIVSIYPKNEPVEPEEPPIEPEIPDKPDEPDTGKATILKHSAGDETKVLSGAQFQVYRIAAADEEAAMVITYNGQEVGLIPVMVDDAPVVITTDENGYAETPELPYGLYFLVETQAPSGYNLLEDPVAVIVTATSQNAENAVKIENIPGVTLPETGGPGTYLFTITGALLCGAAVVLYVNKKFRLAA